MTERALVARRYGIVATTVAFVASPLLALSYFATSEGRDELSEVVIAGWIEPATDVAGPLLTFASPDAAYALYTAVLALLFPAVIFGALETRSSRSEGTRTERWGWRLTLGGYALFGSAVLGHNSLGILPLFIAWISPTMNQELTSASNSAVR